MLKLKDISVEEAIKNESDFYVKIKISFGYRNPLNEPIYYWSSCTHKNSLIEIGIRQHNGAIYEVTILPSHNIHNQEAPIKSEEAIEKIGLPLFETIQWEKHKNCTSNEKFYIKGYYVRKTNNFNIYAGENSVSILFSSNEIVLKVINDSIVFGFDKNNVLCSIQMMGMKLNDEGFLEQNNE